MGRPESELTDDRLGGGAQYLLVDRPASFELHHFTTGEITDAIGAVDLTVGGQPLRFELPTI